MCIMASHLLHHHLLTFSNKLILSFHYSLQKLQVLHMFSVRFYAMYEMLYDFRTDFIAKNGIILKNTAYCLCLSYTGIQEQIQLFMQENLILLIR